MQFVSRRKKLRVVLKPTSYVLDAYGQKIPIPGKTVEFVNGKHITDDPEEINLMLHNVHRGSQYLVAETDAEVAEWYDRNPQYRNAPVMMTGAIGTVNLAHPENAAPAAVTATHGPIREAIAAQRKETPVVDLEKMIEEKIGAKLNPLMEKLDKLLDLERPEPVPAPKPKKVFPCQVPGCGFVGKTGIELGEHKRTAHATIALTE